jgi:hypothetical protein
MISTLGEEVERNMLFGTEHVDRYVATDGEEGHDWKRGAPVLILTTAGRRSAEARSTPLKSQSSFWSGHDR